MKKSNDYIDNVAYCSDSENGDYVLIGGELKLPVSKCTKQAVISKIVEELILSSFDTIIETALNASKTKKPTYFELDKTDLPEIVTLVDPRFLQAHFHEIKKQISISLSSTLETSDLKYVMLKSYCVNGTLDQAQFNETYGSDSIDTTVMAIKAGYFAIVEDYIEGNAKKHKDEKKVETKDEEQKEKGL